jgi:ferredoxin-NADP reductase
LADATLTAREDLSSAMAWFRFRHDEGPRPFAAGQYAPIALPDLPVPPRPYSIASAPGAHHLDFVISLVPQGTLTPALFSLHAGDRAHVGHARGLFRLDAADERDHLLIGTGSGIAPLLSMVAELGSRPRPPRTLLLHGARVQRELAGRAQLVAREDPWLSYRPILSRVPAHHAWRGQRGHVGALLDAILGRRELTPERTVAYLCGNPVMIEGCRARLAAAGMSPDAIRSERFVADPGPRAGS